MYTYLGTNGTLTTPIHLEGIYSIKKLELKADKDKVLTNGEQQYFSIVIPEDELNQWTETDFVEQIPFNE